MLLTVTWPLEYDLRHFCNDWIAIGMCSSTVEMWATHLQQPIASPVEGGQHCRVDVTSVDALEALHLQLHMVLARCLAILALLPTVPVAPVTNLLPRVQHHGSTDGPVKWTYTHKHTWTKWTRNSFAWLVPFCRTLIGQCPVSWLVG